MTDINQPVTVENPAQISVLESAMLALESDSSKPVHLSAGQAAVVLAHIKRLKRRRDESDVICHNLADALSAYEALAHPIIEIWDNEEDAAYDRPNPQPFFMEAE